MTGSEVLHRALVKHAKQQGQQTSIIEAITGKKITYYRLLSSVLSLQNFLGIKSRQTIILATSGGIINSIIWLTSLIFGHFLIPISPNTTESEYNELLEKYTPDILITETEEWMTEPKTKQLSLSDIQKIISRKKTFPKEMPHIADGTIFLQSSGSTGTPKGMILNATQIVITAKNICKRHKLTNTDKGLTPLPFYHVNAPVVSLITSMLVGSIVIIAPKFSASNFWAWVKKYDPTWISIVPTILAILLKSDKPSFLKRSSLRFFRTASAPLPKANLRRFEKKFGFPVIETYGISEGASTIFSNPLPPRKHIPGSVGLALEVDAKIVNIKTGRREKTGKTGEIYIKGEQIIKHYEDGRDKDSFVNGWFRTGDLGYMDKAGYLFITGRKKDIIIRGGENIMPREIEEILLMYPEVIEATVLGKKDDILGEKVVAFLVSDKKDDLFVKELKEFAASQLSPQKVPAELYLLDELPRGKTNKIDKNILREFYPSK
ncbi:MAG TPA: AMP-binding protein [Candidatus Saccharimonadales bacterium]|nr:AMP-binding protein [Candidatus Saccharimonadales bacterium]